jgi:FKBP-type peptidyl-prolyl cis-trans isomerase FkpA
MKLQFPLVAAFVALVSLTACGGGGSSGSSASSTSSTAAADVAVLTTSDTTVGTGPAAIAGKTATVTYTGWLYSATAADHKGTQFDAGSFSFLVGAGQVITGFEQGVLGMQVGGKRTIVIPSSLGYGATGNGGTIPANAGLVFDVALTTLL